MKRLNLWLVLLLLIPLAASAQEEDSEDAVYLRLNANFSVPELRGAWDNIIDGETVLFTRDDLDAQIYVRIVDTLDYTAAIATAIGDLEAVDSNITDPIYEGRIGRTDGTWNYQLFREGDTSITAYALLQSDQIYVVVFAEESADYDAFHLAIRSDNPEPVEEEILEAIRPASAIAIQSALEPTFASEPLSTRNPVETNDLWVEAIYDNDIATASYIYEGIIYVTVVAGDVSSAPLLSNAFDTVFLGFVITPDNAEFLYLGLGFSVAIMLMLIGSMYLRYQNLHKDIQTIEAMADDS